MTMSSNPPNQNDPLNALVVTALFQALDQQKRDELIKKALAALVEPNFDSRGYRSSGKSVLETAFITAVEQVANKIVIEMVSNSEEIRSRIRALCANAVERTFANSEDVASQMSKAFSSWLSSKSY